MPPVVLPLALSAASELVPSIYSIISGRRQQAEGERLLNTQRPVYKIPQSANSMLTLAQGAYADQRLPGQSNIENKIAGNSSNAIHSIMEGGNPNDTINAISSINQNANNATNDLGQAAAAHHNAMLQLYLNELGNHAGYEDKAFAYNEDQPYQSKVKSGSALINAGNVNEFGGVKGIGAMGAQMGSQFLPGGAFYNKDNGFDGTTDLGINSTAKNSDSPWLNYSTQPGTGMSGYYNPSGVPYANKNTPEDNSNLALMYMKYLKNQ